MIAKAEDVKKERTEAQKEASRSNGAKSKGPTSYEGKLRSRRNALRHGILARTLPVESTILTDRREFDAMLENLKEDLKPVSQLELNVVEDIGVTTLRLQTVMRMISIQEERDYGGGVTLEHMRFNDDETRRRGTIIGKVASWLQKRSELDLTEAEHKIAVEVVWDRLDGYREKVAEAKEDLDDLKEDGAEKARITRAQTKLRKAQSEANTKGARKYAFGKPDDVSAALRGEHKFSHKQRRLWGTLIEELAESYSSSADRTEGHNEVAEASQAERLHFPPHGDTPRMQTLYTYEARLRSQLRRLYGDLETVRSIVRE